MLSMNVRSWPASFLVRLALLLAPAAAIAQSIPPNCRREHVDSLGDAELGQWKGFRPSELRKRFAPAREAGAWSALADSLEIFFLKRAAASVEVPPASLEGLDADRLAALLSQLDSLRQELRAGDADFTARVRGAVTQNRFDLFIRTAVPIRVSLFDGRPPTARIRIDSLPMITQQTVCWLAMAAADLATAFGGPGRVALERALSERVERWDNFTRNGYSMFPLELLINGWLPREPLEPPTMQLIALHASVGAGMVGKSLTKLSQLERVEVLNVEPVGILFYGPQRRWYLGASWLLASPSDGATGHGIMLHLGKFGRFAYVRRRSDAGVRENGVLLSLDLYRYLTGVADLWQKRKVAAVADCLADAPKCTSAKK